MVYRAKMTQYLHWTFPLEPLYNFQVDFNCRPDSFAGQLEVSVLELRPGSATCEHAPYSNVKKSGTYSILFSNLCSRPINFRFRMSSRYPGGIPCELWLKVQLTESIIKMGKKLNQKKSLLSFQINIEVKKNPPFN